MHRFVKVIKKASLLIPTFVFFVLPASTGYQLKGYTFGGGGGIGTSTNYKAEGSVGQLEGKQSSTLYKANSGLIFVQQANTPIAPIFSNTGSWYSKLFFKINTSNNPADATYAIAITDDNWVTTKYVQSDNTVGTAWGISNFQTYTAWGGSSGGFIIGLTPNTTYQIKVKARQGKYTEGPFGIAATATTSTVTLTTDIDIASTDIETASPYSIDVGTLSGGTVTTATNKIWIDIDTNANNGGQVFIYDQYAGLRSASTSYTIASVTGDLTSLSTGFGLIGNSVTQTSGGPLNFVSPYNGTLNNVGIVNTSIRAILSANSPIVAGRASILVKAKVTTTTPAATDYTDLFTVIAAGSF